MKFPRKLLILPPAAAGVLVLAYFVNTRDEPTATDRGERETPAEVRTVEPRAVVPRAVGYGVVEPARSWRAMAEVSGRIVSVHPRLEIGEVLEQGTELLRIDPTEYELKVSQLEADLRSTEAEQEKLQIGVENTRSSLEVAQQGLELAERELQRLVKLSAAGTVSESSVDAQERQVLQERSKVVEYENSLRTAEADAKVYDARLASTQAQLDETRLQLERTVVEVPFSCRIGSVSVEEAQFVSIGAALIEADDIAVAEIQVDLAVDRVRNLIGPAQRQDAALVLELEEIWSQLGLEATVHLRGAGFEYSWPARFERVAGFLDAKTRTVGLVAAVDEPYRGAVGEERPPLAKGMFVEVEFRGRSTGPHVVVPLSALHEGRVYLADGEDRLEIRSIETAFVQDDEAVVASGVEPGERLVLTDLIPAIPGMLLSLRDEAR